MKKLLVKFIPNAVKPMLKKIYYAPLDVIEGVKSGGRLIPPRRLIFVGGGDFEQIGEDFKKYFIELAGLSRTDRVLDVGCGIGRMAVPLTTYLTEGEYWGFDIVKEGIDWSRSRISKKFPNFHFQHVDVFNKLYNPGGKVLASDFRFPFEDDFFDFLFLTSVFTHMLPADLEHYLSEISRVLKSNGKCLITFFLLNKESEMLIDSGLSDIDFSHEIEGCKTSNENNPEVALAYREDFVVNLFEKYELKIQQPIKYGYWSSREAFLSYQDILIAEKN